MHPKEISILDFTYHLPDEKIALHPLEERDASRLLIYKDGFISEDTYSNIDEYLPGNSLLVFNNTKVINARILFTKPTGGVIEIFLLEPYHADYTSTLTATKSCEWKCLIGGASKWKDGALELTTENYTLSAQLKEKLPDAYVVALNWNGNVPFAEILEHTGNIPLPPYIKRKVDEDDKARYQTIYAAHDGSVAAPTAGLHFTPTVFEKLAAKNISKNFVTLHVGAGTFKPVKAATMQGHEMHAEWIDVSIECIENCIRNIDNNIIAVGTTSLRTLESLYWLGVKAALDPLLPQLNITQWEVYDELALQETIPAAKALEALIAWLKKNKLTKLFTQTQILIAPGYQFKIAKAIITNFHQPQSTLLLLVSAAVGNNWRTIYDYALENDFRFLSYGDGSLLFI
ncbi:S-adenosylmethionine:tRNA ribosyltransferase-isomerase [Ferruginibacter sp. SUN106]|uniref:S-adenosylmethionine:tRNA ribosyltransferase-isomerase n=1 Tax=Ferruginibacter sp. SUN106 TaxID=2978348 RepID=UPI003D35E876